MTDRFRLLVVDSEPQSTRVLDGVLTGHAYHVRTAADGESALAGFTAWQPHLVVADVYTPHMDGVELCRRIRAISRVPIIVLSGRNAEAAKVAALDSGADDYVTKPFGVNEFLARIRAALRRSGESTLEVTDLDLGDFRVDLAARRVYVSGLEVRLTPKEFDLSEPWVVMHSSHPRQSLPLGRYEGRNAVASGRNEAVFDRVLNQLGAGLQPKKLHGAVFVEFDGSRADVENRRHLLHRFALRKELKDLTLARAQVAQPRVRRLEVEPGVHHPFGNRRRDIAPALERLSDGGRQLGRRGIFQQVPRCLSPERFCRDARLTVLREVDDLDVRVQRFQLLAGVEAVQERHRNIDDDDFGFQFRGGLEQCTSVADGAHDVEVGLKKIRQRLDHHRVIVGEKNARTLHAPSPMSGSVTVPLL
jgi:two-component system KDP operon response regulator KdpE